MTPFYTDIIMLKLSNITVLLFLLLSILAVPCSGEPGWVPAKPGIQKEFSLEPGTWYCLTGTVKVDEKDLSGENPLFCVKFFFENEFRNSDLSETYLSPAADGKSAYKYIFAEDLIFRKNGIREYKFQFKTPADIKKTRVYVSGWKNKYPAQIGPLLSERNPAAPVYISEIPLQKRLRLNRYTDLIRISGNVKTGEKLPDGKLIATVKLSDFMHHKLSPVSKLAYSPVLKEHYIYLKPDASGNFVHEIQIPHNSAEIKVGIRTFFYRGKVELSDLKLEQLFMPRQLRSKDIVFEQEVSGGNVAEITGALADESGILHGKSAYLRIYVMDKTGKVLPVPGLPVNREKNYHYVYLPQKNGEGSFRIKFKIPLHAKKIRVVFARFFNDRKLTLKYFDVQERTQPLTFRLREAGIKLTPDFMTKEAVLDQILDYLMPGMKVEEFAASELFPGLPVPLGHGYIFNPAGKNDPGWMSVKGFPPYRLPSKLEWNENPYSHSAWQQKYYTLYWAVTSDQNRKDAEYIKTVMKSFFERSPFTFHKHPMCYEDHAVSCRLEGMLALYHGVKKERQVFDFVLFSGIRSKRELLAADPLFMKQYFVQMLIDAENIYEYLQNRTLGIHNHNLFMARALLSLSLAFPKLPKLEIYYKTAVDTIVSHLSMMLETDHVTAEQAAIYQHVLLTYFFELSCWMESMESFDRELKEYVRLKVRNILLADRDMIDPNGSFFTMGDTVSARGILREFNMMRRVFAERTNMKDLRDLPVQKRSVYRESGIYIFRNPEKNRVLFIDISANQKVHGHFDQGNFILFAGRPLITDGGGPYRYGSKIYRLLMSSQSHNVAAPYGVQQMAGEASRIIYQEHKDYYYLAFCSNVYGPDYVYYREFTVRKDLSSIKIRDQFLSFTGKSTVPLCRSQLIFPAEESAVLTGKDGIWRIPDGKYPENGLCVKFSGNSGKAELRNFLRTIEVNQLQLTKHLSIPFLFGETLVTEIELGGK